MIGKNESHSEPTITQAYKRDVDKLRFDPKLLAQECILIFDVEWKKNLARVTYTNAIRIDSEAFSRFYFKSEILRDLDREEYIKMRKFIIKTFQKRENSDA